MTWSEAGTCVRATQIGPDSDRLTGKKCYLYWEESCHGRAFRSERPDGQRGQPRPSIQRGLLLHQTYWTSALQPPVTK